MVVTANADPFHKNDPRMIRLKHRDTGEFLHMSGTGTCRGELWAWLGYRYQAEARKERAAIRGEEWPFLVSGRSDG